MRFRPALAPWHDERERSGRHHDDLESSSKVADVLVLNGESAGDGPDRQDRAPLDAYDPSQAHGG
jgi:hypothetical protein